MTFHGTPRMDEHTRQHIRESPFVVTFPLVMLAIPSVLAGGMYIEPMLFGNLFGSSGCLPLPNMPPPCSIAVAPEHAVWLAEMGRDYRGIGPFIADGLQALPFFLAVAGIIAAWLLYIRYPHLPDVIRGKAQFLYTLLARKYFLDDFNEIVFAGGARRIGSFFWKVGDVNLIDGLAVNGTARVVRWVASVIRYIQTGYVYHYAFAMILGLFLLMTFFLRLT